MELNIIESNDSTRVTFKVENKKRVYTRKVRTDINDNRYFLFRKNEIFLGQNTNINLHTNSFYK